MKLYESEVWLRRKFTTERKSPEEIAKICDVTVMTIYRYLNKYGMIKKR